MAQHNQSPQGAPYKIVTWVKKNYFDTNGDFDFNNNRFKPSIPGTYLLTATISMDDLASFDSDGLTQFVLAIFKNGSVYALGNNQVLSSNDAYSDPVRSVTVVAEANGNTDYFDVRVFHDDSYGSRNIFGESERTYFSGSLL